MKIFMIDYGDELCSHVAQCFAACGQDMVMFSFPEPVYTDRYVMLSETNRNALINALKSSVFDTVFSIQYLHEVSVCANALGVIYLSWILHLPNPDIYRSSVSNLCNAIFACDSYIVELIRSTGAENVFYLPNGAFSADKTLFEATGEFTDYKFSYKRTIKENDVIKIDEENIETDNVVSEAGSVMTEADDIITETDAPLLEAKLDVDNDKDKVAENNDKPGEYDASFIGSVQSVKSDSVFGIESLLSDTCRGYLDGMAHSQRLSYNKDIIAGNIPKHIMEELLEKYPVLAPNDIYTGVDELILNDVFRPYITAQERMILLSNVKRMVKIFSDWDMPEDTKEKYFMHDKINDISERREIYSRSKLGVYIANRAMINGIPHQCFDIMSAGSMLITGPQKDLYNHFTSGKELIVFEDSFDFEQKVLIYLHNDDDRNEIIENAREKIRNEHLIIHRIQELLSVF